MLSPETIQTTSRSECCPLKPWGSSQTLGVLPDPGGPPKPPGVLQQTDLGGDVQQPEGGGAHLQHHALAPQLVGLRQLGEACPGRLHVGHLAAPQRDGQQVLQRRRGGDELDRNHTTGPPVRALQSLESTTGLSTFG